MWDSEYEIDFNIIGMVSSMKEHKMGWHLNQIDLFHLVKVEDIKIEFAKSKIIRISNLAAETDFSAVHLLRNRLSGGGLNGNQYLLPEIKEFDYLLRIKNIIDDNWSASILEKIKSAKISDYAVLIDVEKIRTKENLIF